MPCLDHPGQKIVWVFFADYTRLDFPEFARHQIALKSNSMRGVYEEQAIHYEVLGQYESATEQQDLYLSILEAVYGTASYETAGGMIRLAALT